MEKEITLYRIDGNTSEIGVRYDGVQWKKTGIIVRQEQDGTKAWHKTTGKAISLPKTRYALSNESDWLKLCDDLDEQGLLGHEYTISGALTNAEAFNTGDSALDRKLMRCYDDIICLGVFLSDTEAIARAEEIQNRADEDAREILREAGLSDDLGSSGASYVAHLFREEPDGTEVQVEI